MLLGAVSELSTVLSFPQQSRECVRCPGAGKCCSSAAIQASGTRRLCQLCWQVSELLQHLYQPLSGSANAAIASGRSWVKWLLPCALRLLWHQELNIHLGWSLSINPRPLVWGGACGGLFTWPGVRGNAHTELGGRCSPPWYWLEDEREGRKRRERRGVPTHKVQQYFKHPLFPISVKQVLNKAIFQLVLSLWKRGFGSLVRPCNDR